MCLGQRKEAKIGAQWRRRHGVGGKEDVVALSDVMMAAMKMAKVTTQSVMEGRLKRIMKDKTSGQRQWIIFGQT